MNGITKSKSTKLLSALLAVLMIVAMLPTTAFAWSVEEGTKCTSTYGDHYVGSDGEMFYSKPTTTAIFYNDDGSFYVKTYSSGNAKYKYMMIDGNGNQHHVYCIEGGVSFDYSDTYNSTSGKNSKYFQNLPITAQYGIMMALMYGYHEGMTSPIPGTNNDDFAFATQCIIWEYQQQLRTSPTSIASNNGIDADMYNHTIKGRPAEQCYNWILEQMSKHYVVPSFSSRNQSNAQTYTMKYDQANDNYSITLTDTNNTLADINFSASGITVTRSGNQYTFTSKNMISNAVMISAQKKTNLGMGKMLIWGCPGKQTMASGAEDPVFFYLKLNTETYGVGHIVKTSEDGKVEGIKFNISGNGVNETVTTGKNGTVDLDLLPGTYTVTEQTDDKYETQSAQTVTIVSGKTSTVTFNNTLRRGDLKVTKTSEDGLVEGMKFHLYGTSYCGLPVDEYSVTDASGMAVFDDVLIGTSYTLEEVGTPDRYIVPDDQTAAIEWNKVTNKSFDNDLKRGDLKVTKTAEDGLNEGLKFHLYGTSYSGIPVDEYDGALKARAANAKGYFEVASNGTADFGKKDIASCYYSICKFMTSQSTTSEHALDDYTKLFEEINQAMAIVENANDSESNYDKISLYYVTLLLINDQSKYMAGVGFDQQEALNMMEAIYKKTIAITSTLPYVTELQDKIKGDYETFITTVNNNYNEVAKRQNGGN